MTLLILRAADIARGCTMRDAIDAVAQGFEALSLGRAHAPARVGVPLPADAVSLAMPCSIEGWPFASVKLVSVVPANATRGLPVTTASITLIDAATAMPLAILDGTSLTALRTGAAGGVAARVLATPDAAVLALFGAGAQARAQLLGAHAARPLREARVSDTDPARVEAFIAWTRTVPDLAGVKVSAASPREAVRGANLIATATTSATPVFEGAWLEPGVHITAVGAFQPSKRELDEMTMRGARLVVDEREAAFSEAGELAGLRAEDAVEIGEVLAGKAVGRRAASERTVFKSVGNAVQDLVVASRIYERAKREGFGEEVAALA